MESFPAFHDPAKFPAFSSIPHAAPDPNAVADFAQSKDSDLQSPYSLLGTISENMTLGTNPTFICKDRDMVPFAVTIKLDSSAKGEKFDVKACKKGYTMAIRDAKKYGVKEGKQGFIETTVEGIKIIPISVDKLIEMGSVKESLFIGSGDHSGLRRCQGCSMEKNSDELSRCKGCEAVWYCDKKCQATGWSEKGHKTYCKILRAVRGLGGE